MSMGKAEAGQANEADVTTNGSKPDIKSWCECLNGFMSFDEPNQGCVRNTHA